MRLKYRYPNNRVIKILLLPIIISLFIGCTHYSYNSYSLKPGKLNEAVKMGDLQKVKDLINKGENINALDENGLAPLHKATANSYIDIIELLLSNKHYKRDLIISISIYFRIRICKCDAPRLRSERVGSGVLQYERLV